MFKKLFTPRAKLGLHQKSKMELFVILDDDVKMLDGVLKSPATVDFIRKSMLFDIL